MVKKYIFCFFGQNHNSIMIKKLTISNVFLKAYYYDGNPQISLILYF